MTLGNVFGYYGAHSFAQDRGTIEVEAGGVVTLGSIVYDQSLITVGGSILVAAGTTTGMDGVDVEGELDVEANATLRFADVGGSVGFYSFQYMDVTGTIALFGANIVLDQSETLVAQDLGLAPGQTGGVLDLSASGAVGTITASGSYTLQNTNILIEGQGTIGDGTNLMLVNQGTIDGDIAATQLNIELIDNGMVTGSNSGLFEATNGSDVSIISGDRGDAVFTNTGTLEAFAGSTLEMDQVSLTNIANGVLTGGTWEASGQGALLEFDSDYAFTGDAATLILSGAGSAIGDGGSTLEQVLTDIAAGGTLEVLAARGYTTSKALTLEGTLQLGGGTFASGALKAAVKSSLTGFGTVSSALTSAGAVTAAGGTLTFTGTDSFSGALGGGALAFSNDAVGLAKGASLAAQSVALSGVTLSLGASLSYAASILTVPTSFTETASTLSLAKGVTLTLLGATTLAGGGETGAGTLTLKGAATSSGFTVAGGASLMIGGSLDMTKALILGGAAGTGKLGILAGGLVDLSGAASISVASGSTATLANSGTLEKADGGLTAAVSVAISNFGTILAASGVLDFTAAVSGPGKVVVQSGATIEFDAAEAGALSFGTGGGTLRLGSAASFKGAITGLGGTGTRLDLAGFGTGTTDTYTANSQGTGGTLKLVDGSKTTSLTLVGSYTAGGFHLSNGSTDTLVSYTAPAAAAAHPATTAAHADTHAFAAALFDAAFAGGTVDAAATHAVTAIPITLAAAHEATVTI